jgi:hypothetical protein
VAKKKSFSGQLLGKASKIPPTVTQNFAAKLPISKKTVKGDLLMEQSPFGKFTCCAA